MEKILLPEHIWLDGAANDANDVIHGLAERLGRTGCIADEASFVRCVYERERLGFTGAGRGIAIPHGVGPGVRRIAVAIARTKNEIEWPNYSEEEVEEEERRVRLIVLFAVPDVCGNAEQKSEYIRALKTVMTALADGEKTKRLLRVESPEEVIDTLTR